jgi:hypothetical protein
MAYNILALLTFFSLGFIVLLGIRCEKLKPNAETPSAKEIATTDVMTGHRSGR